MGRKNNYLLNAKIVKNKDLFLNVIEPRRETLQRQLNYLISQGYIPYDVSDPANNGFEGLSTITPGKYVCIWKNLPLTSYTLVLADIIRHTSIIILNARINSLLYITDIITNDFSIPSGDYQGKLTFIGGIINLISATNVQNVQFNDNYYEACCIVNINTANISITNPIFKNCYINNSKNISIIFSTAPTVNNSFIKNCIFNSLINTTIELKISVSTTNDFFTNVHFIQNTDCLLKIYADSIYVCNFTAIKLIANQNFNFNLQLDKIYSTNNSTFFYENNINLIGGSSGFSWQLMPSAGSTAGSAEYIDIGYDENEVLYRAYSDGANGGKLTIEKYVNNSWIVVGSAGISAGTATYISMYIISSSEIYVGYSDGNASGKATVKKWDGSNWSTLGSAGFTVGAMSYLTLSSKSYYPNILFLYGRDAGHSNFISYYYFDTTIWNYEGNSGYIGKSITKSLAFQVFHLSYAESIFLTDIGQVYYYINDLLVGNQLLEEVSLAAAICFDSVIVCAKIYGIYFIVIKNSVTNKLSGYLFNAGYNTLNQIGDSNFSNSVGNYISVWAQNNTYYVAYQDVDNNNKISVMTWNGSNWVHIPSAGISTGQANYICIGYKNVPIVAYKDLAQSNKMTVMKYDISGVILICNYNFKYSINDFFKGEFGLNISLLNDNNLVKQWLTIRPISEISFIKTNIIKNFYTLEFNENRIVNDKLKQIGAEDTILVKMFEVEEFNRKWLNLPAPYYAIILNYSFCCNPDFSLLICDCNENFILFCSSQKGPGIFCFYNKQLYQTIYTDIYKDVIYTIESIWQIWQIKTPMNVYNKYPDIANSPVIGESLTVNNLDNEIII